MEDKNCISGQTGIPIPESNDLKEAYAFLGLFVFESVGLERLVATFLSIEKVKRAKINSAKERLIFWDRTYQNLAKMPLGQLLEENKKSGAFEEGLFQELEAAVSIRNRIIHRLAWDDAEKFCTEFGRKKLIDDLRSGLIQLEATSKRLEGFIEIEGRRLGVTHEIVAAKMRELLENSVIDNGTA